jgi:hypothetical protein
MSAVDEPAAAMWAAAAVRGEFFKPLTPVAQLGYETSIVLPSDLAGFNGLFNCLSSPQQPASCMHYSPTAANPASTTTQFAQYPPLYFLAVGWPTLLFHGLSAGWAERFMTVLITSTLLALGLWMLVSFHPRRTVLLGYLLALTAPVVYLSGTINSSALEISAAVATWCGVLCLAAVRHPPPRLIVATAVATAILILARPISPLFALLAIVAAVALCGRSTLRRLAGDRVVRAGALGVAASLLGAGMWILLAGTPVLLKGPSAVAPTAADGFQYGVAETPTYLAGMVERFADVHAPSLVVGIAAFMLGVLVLLALQRGRRWRYLMVSLLIAALVLIVPIAFQTFAVATAGANWWQPRYGLPLAVGLPLVLAAGIPKLPSHLLRTLTVGAIALAAAVMQSVAHVWLVRRYSTGADGSFIPTATSWQPRGGVVLDDLLFVAAAVVLSVCVAWWASPPSHAVAA